MKILISMLFLFALTVVSFGQKSGYDDDQTLFSERKNKPESRRLPQGRTRNENDPENQSGRPRRARELFKGVTPDEAKRGFVSFSPEETNGIFKSVKIKNKTAYINFNKVVYEQMGSATTSCGGGFFSSIEKTLFQFPTIKKVFYAIEGNPADFYDWVQVGECPAELKNCSGKNF